MPIGGLATARMVLRRKAAKTNQTFIIDNSFQIANNPTTFSPLYVAESFKIFLRVVTPAAAAAKEKDCIPA